MKTISNLDEYLEAERQADALYEKPWRQAELDELIEMMSDYEEKHPEEISKIYGDETNLPEPEDPFEDWVRSTFREEDYY